MASKKQNPVVTWRKSRRKILDMFKNRKSLTWSELLKKAKEENIHYITFRKHIKTLISTKIIKQEIDTSEIPAVVKHRYDFERLIDEDIVYLDDVVSFIEENSRNLHQVGMSQFGEIFISEKTGKSIVESLSKTLQYTIRESIHDEWRKEVLSKYSQKEKGIIEKYEKALSNYMWLHQYLKKENLTKKSIENVENITKLRFYSFSSAKKWINQQKKEPPKLFGMVGFKMPSTQKELRKKKMLETFLAEHENLYEQFRKEVDDIPKIVAIFPSYSFRGYIRKAAQNLYQLPLKEKLTIRVTEENKDDYKKLISSYLEQFGDQQLAYMCQICGQVYKKQKKIRDHIKDDEKYSDPDELIQPLDKKYFEEGLDFLEKKNLPVENNRINADESSLDRMEKEFEDSMKDIRTMARLEGLSVAKVKKQLKVKD